MIINKLTIKMPNRHSKGFHEKTINSDLEHVSSPQKTAKFGQRFVGNNLTDLLSPTS